MKNYTITTTTNEVVNALCEKARAALEARKDRSAWDRGVTLYAFDLLDHMEDSADYWTTAKPPKNSSLTVPVIGGSTAGVALPSVMMEILPSVFAARPN